MPIFDPIGRALGVVGSEGLETRVSNAWLRVGLVPWEAHLSDG